MRAIRVAIKLGACLLGLSLASGAALAQMPQNLVFPAEPDRTIDLGNDREIHVYNATVLRASGNRLTVRYDHGERYTYNVPPSYRFEMDGRKVHTRDLNRGDKLTAYVTVHNTSHHAIHHIEESGGSVSVLNTITPEPVADMLPATASPLPLIGLLGAISLGLGGLGLAIRRRLA